MKQKSRGKEYIAIGIIVVLFIGVSILSHSSIRQMQGHARVVNYVGIVRGATQKLVKKELQGHPDDALITRLDGIVSELISGSGSNNLIALKDETFQNHMREVLSQWKDLKQMIILVRGGGAPDGLYEASEEYFDLVDRTVSSAEEYSERQVNRTIRILTGVNVVFVLILLVSLAYYLRTAALSSKAEALTRIAYLDPLTQIPNRAHCDYEIESRMHDHSDNRVAVMIFDMDGLKKVNESLGHQAGDRLIADLAEILKAESGECGFLGRYGGDEFLVLFEAVDEDKINRFITRVTQKVNNYNQMRSNPLERLYFAAGYCTGNLKETKLQDLIHEADRRMYLQKRQVAGSSS